MRSNFTTRIQRVRKTDTKCYNVKKKKAVGQHKIAVGRCGKLMNGYAGEILPFLQGNFTW